MYYREFKPDGELNRFIKCIWVLERDYSEQSSLTGERLWPNGLMEIIFTSGQPYSRLVNGNLELLPAKFVIGQLSQQLSLESGGVTKVLGIRLLPWALHPLVDRPVNEFADKVFEFHKVFSSDVSARLEDMKTTDEATEVSIKRIETLLHEIYFDKPVTLAERVAGEIYRLQTDIGIRDLVELNEVSPRTFQRKSKAEVGITARKLIKILRFNQAKRQIEQREELDMATLAGNCGYSDQAHFSHDFKEIFGITPIEHQRVVSKVKNHLANTDSHVVFLQDQTSQKY